MPGVKNYRPGVLMNNWFEDTCKYKKDKHSHNLEYRTDYQRAGYQKPDTIIARGSTISEKGIPLKFDLYRHSGDYSEHLISMHDQEYARRPRTLPPLRNFSTQVMAWIPEQSDHPLRGKPTSWGLIEKKQRKWNEEMESLNLGRTPMSDYKEAFVRFPNDYLRETVKKKYDVPVLTASADVPAGKPLDPLFVAARTGRDFR